MNVPQEIIDYLVEKPELYIHRKLALFVAFWGMGMGFLIGLVTGVKVFR